MNLDVVATVVATLVAGVGGGWVGSRATRQATTREIRAIEKENLRQRLRDHISQIRGFTRDLDGIIEKVDNRCVDCEEFIESGVDIGRIKRWRLSEPASIGNFFSLDISDDTSDQVQVFRRNIDSVIEALEELRDPELEMRDVGSFHELLVELKESGIELRRKMQIDLRSLENRAA